MFHQEVQDEVEKKENLGKKLTVSKFPRLFRSINLQTLGKELNENFDACFTFFQLLDKNTSTRVNFTEHRVIGTLINFEIEDISLIKMKPRFFGNQIK